MIWTQICFRPETISGPEVARSSRAYLGFEAQFIKIHRSLKTTRFNPEKHYEFIEKQENFPSVTIADGNPEKLRKKQSFESIRITPHVEVLNWFTAEAVPDKVVEELACGQEAFSIANVHDYDDIHWQSEEQIDVYEYAGRPYSQDDIISHPLFERAVDISKNPGRREIFPGMLIQPSWKMWFGPWAFRYLPKERLLSFPDAYLVEERANLVFIQLYERLEDFELPENRRRQQSFRDYMGLDELIQRSSEIFKRDLEPLLSKDVAPEDQYFTIDR